MRKRKMGEGKEGREGNKKGGGGTNKRKGKEQVEEAQQHFTDGTNPTTNNTFLFPYLCIPWAQFSPLAWCLKIRTRV